MKKSFLLMGFAVFSLVGMLFAAFPTDSQAIPPFARKYKTACTTCHWGTFPQHRPQPGWEPAACRGVSALPRQGRHQRSTHPTYRSGGLGVLISLRPEPWQTICSG